MKILRVKFNGKEYLFGGNSLEESGFIATEEQFSNFEESFAHYFPDRGVMRYHQVIGSKSDLSVIGERED